MSELAQEIEVYEAPPAPTLFRSDDPKDIIERATETANILKAVVVKQNLVTKISGRDHARVEAWTMLGSLLGVFPVCVWSRELIAADGSQRGWEARVEARTRDGAIVGAAEAECLYSEKTWANREDYALRSMAQTRATSKALRQPLGFVMTLAGFDATPAEEMPSTPPSESKMISESQRKRLYALSKKSNLTDEQLKALVVEIAGVESSKDIAVSVYDRLCEAVEAEGQPF